MLTEHNRRERHPGAQAGVNPRPRGSSDGCAGCAQAASLTRASTAAWPRLKMWIYWLGSVVCAHREQPWMGILSQQGKVSWLWTPTAMCLEGAVLSCFPPPFVHSHLLSPQPPSQRERVTVCPPPCKQGVEPSLPTHTDSLVLLGSVSVQYVLNFLLHQPSCNQLWITIVS